MDLPAMKILSVWERHPQPGVKEQPVHFVRKRTDARKSVEAIGLEDSQEWHRNHYKDIMHDDPWDRAILLQCQAHYTELKKEFPQLAHYWDDPEATFGEQLQVDGITADEICLGDVLQSEYGPLRLQVTCPRKACFRVDHRYPAIPPIEHSGQPGTVRQWTCANGRAGFFCRVLRPGSLQEGDGMRIIERHRPEFSLSRLARMWYSITPNRVDWMGNDDELQTLCEAEDLCKFEWRQPLKDYRANLVKKKPLVAHEDFGHPVEYDEGLRLLAGVWWTKGSSSHCSHEVGMFPQAEAQSQEDVVVISVEAPEKITADKPAFEDKPFRAKTCDHHGKFALEVDMGGFPSFPRYAYMTKSGSSAMSVYMVFSDGSRWFKPPEGA